MPELTHTISIIAFAIKPIQLKISLLKHQHALIIAKVSAGISIQLVD